MQVSKWWETVNFEQISIAIWYNDASTNWALKQQIGNSNQQQAAVAAVTVAAVAAALAAVSNVSSKQLEAGAATTGSFTNIKQFS